MVPGTLVGGNLKATCEDISITEMEFVIPYVIAKSVATQCFFAHGVGKYAGSGYA